jgi:hypothetical protein
VRRWVVLLALALAGCGGERTLGFVSFEPPAGSEARGVTGTDRGPSDPDRGQPIFRFVARIGEPLSYTVRVRNATGAAVTVTGVRHDPGRGPFEERAVEGAPLEIAPGAEAPVTVTGVVRRCDYGPDQLVALADPELELRTAGGQKRTQVVVTNTATEFTIDEAGRCR